MTVSIIVESIEKRLASGQYEPLQRAALDYIVSGKEAHRRHIPMLNAADFNYSQQLRDTELKLLPGPGDLDDPARRLVEVLVRLAQYFELARWLKPTMLADAGEDCQAILVEAFSGAGRDTAELIEAVIDRFPMERPDGEPTSAGRWLLAQSDEDLLRGVRRTHISAGDGLTALVELLRRRRPEQLEVVGPAIVARPADQIHERVAVRHVGRNRHAFPSRAETDAGRGTDVPRRRCGHEG